MPKKRHQGRYSKPQSTAPAALSSSSDHERPGVNQLLASLRRTRRDGDKPQSPVSVANIAAPSVPPQIREILSLPETPAPAPRRRPRFNPRFDALGRRMPAGPPPPLSWLALSRQTQRLGTSDQDPQDYEQCLLPGLYRPNRGSLSDMILRQMALDWDFQRSYNVYYLYSLPTRLRMALISCVATSYEPGLSLSDLKTILIPQVPNDDDKDDEDEDDRHALSPSSLNEGLTHLDLSTLVGRTIKLRDLSRLLFPSKSQKSEGAVLESWDAVESPPVPRPLLPNLTHLSLAATPDTSAINSWRQLLSLSENLPTLTHLSLAYWPKPSLTPNSTFWKVVTPQGQTVQAGGTNYYSHTLDNDWSEAILILRKLSQNLYGLEYLDVTGCLSWFTALAEKKDGDQIDWAGAWGKVTHLVMHTGSSAPLKPEATSKYTEWLFTMDKAHSIEKTVRAQRAGRGRIFTVERTKWGGDVSSG
ncbi:hypothetical protein M406DRAFT_251712 [Cryphonectria parasitica EP155]|uniref:Tafazzin n=1 Tax=Cryphonectria parasitica (strain ATCC 38755 / EP155) TaxID=660469 RepID=A0A9P4Y779_CRYP1|nr:uncharacterized protein M406DRAFT_251712 [Cryphonectria parasitica EP155]KAF3767637.1 hypothetical protein M406DRAFT_251712 [Cryphonectria parasitica EP155]